MAHQYNAKMATMTLIPHPPIYLTEIRPLDIWILLGIGFGWEILSRLVVLSCKMKPKSLLLKEDRLQILQRETKRMRDMGPSKFVETSKLERQVLAKEREIEGVRSARKKLEERMETIFRRYISMILTVGVFVLYYGVPILTMEESSGIEQGGIGEYTTPGPSFSTIFFPIGNLGIGMRIARWGLPDPSNSIGALVVLWSGQVFAGKLMDAIYLFLL